MSPELQQLRDEIEAVVLDLLCPTSCGHRISSGGMTVDATNRMTSFYKQGGPCAVHVSMARAIAQRIMPIAEHFGSGTDLEAANEWEYGVLFHDQDLDDHYGHTAERALLLAGEVDWRVPEFQRRHPASAWETCPASSVVAAAVGEPVPTEESPK